MNTILQGDVIEQLRTLPDESVHCCVTSPPYWGLRDYGTAQWEGGDGGCDHLDAEKSAELERQAKSMRAVGERCDGSVRTCAHHTERGSQIAYRHICGKCGAKRIDSQLGLEKTPEEYVAKMVEVFREVRRVLRKDGTLWLNLGDSYAGSGKGAWDNKDGGQKEVYIPDADSPQALLPKVPPGLKQKDLCGIPWRVAFALQADGWWLRSDIIWAKPNPMPESVTDRPTKAHEYFFLLTKSANYFYDAEAIREKYIEPMNRWGGQKLVANGDSMWDAGTGQQTYRDRDMRPDPNGRNKRSVWTVATAPYPEAHFATYPPDLIKPCILAGTSAKGCCAKCGSPWERIVETKPMVIRRTDRMSEMGEFGRYQSSGTMESPAEAKTIGWLPTCECEIDGFHPVTYPFTPCTVLDPFAGSGTTGAVAIELGRKAILIELNPRYVELIKRRCDVTPGLQLA